MLEKLENGFNIELGKECDLYFALRGKQINDVKKEKKMYNKIKSSKAFFNEEKSKNLNNESHPFYVRPQ